VSAKRKPKLKNREATEVTTAISHFECAAAFCRKNPATGKGARRGYTSIGNRQSAAAPNASAL
jgi:hypothetical protein